MPPRNSDYKLQDIMGMMKDFDIEMFYRLVFFIFLCLNLIFFKIYIINWCFFLWFIHYLCVSIKIFGKPMLRVLLYSYPNGAKKGRNLVSRLKIRFWACGAKRARTETRSQFFWDIGLDSRTTLPSLVLVEKRFLALWPSKIL